MKAWERKKEASKKEQIQGQEDVYRISIFLLHKKEWRELQVQMVRSDGDR